MLVLAAQCSTTFAQTTAFTYQGRLTVGGVLTNGNFDLRFTIYDALANGNRVAGPLTNATTAVTNGLFTVQLDFGAGAFTGPDRWLEMGVRPGGSNSTPFTTLSPRQPVTPTPYALMAQTVNAAGIQGTVPDASLSANVPLLNQQQTYTAPVNIAVAGGAVPLTISGDPGNPANLLQITAPANSNKLVVNSQGFLGINTTNPTAALTISNNSSTVAQVFQAPNVGWPQQNDFHFRVAHSAQGYQYHGTNFPDEKQFGFSFNYNEVGGKQSTNEAIYEDLLETDWVDPDSGERQIERYNHYVSPGGEWDGRPEGWVMRKNALYKNFLCDLFGIYDPLNRLGLGISFGSSRNNTNNFVNGSATMSLYGIFNTHSNIQNSGGISVMDAGFLGFSGVGNTNTTTFGQDMWNANYFETANNSSSIWRMQGFSKIMPVVPVQINGGYGSMSSNAVPLTVTAPVNANANLFEARSSGGTLLSGIDKNGNVFAPNISSNNITGTTVSNYCGNVITNLFVNNQFPAPVQFANSISCYGSLWLNGGINLMLRGGSYANFYNSDNSRGTYINMQGSDLNFESFSATRYIFNEPVVASMANDNWSNSVPLTAKGAATQVANLIEARKGNTLVAAVDANGNGLFANWRNGVTSIANMVTNVTVTFSSPLANTNYSVVVTPEFNTDGMNWWAANKTTNGFTFNHSAGVSGGGTVSWQAILSQ